MSFVLPSGPLPDAETMRKLELEGKLPPGIYPPPKRSKAPRFDLPDDSKKFDEDGFY